MNLLLVVPKNLPPPQDIRALLHLAQKKPKIFLEESLQKDFLEVTTTIPLVLNLTKFLLLVDRHLD
jgi:hypothetical protein